MRVSTQARRREDQIRLAITLVFDCIGTQLNGLRYCFVGTAASVVQGIPLRAGDIDILMEKREGVDIFSRALPAFPCLKPPTWLPDARQYYAAFQVNGVKVEASTVERPTDSDCLETLGEGPWAHCKRIRFGGHFVPTIRLELRLATELALRRRERYTPLIRWLRIHGCNMKLLQQAMSAQGIPTDRQARVLERLSAK